MPNEGAHSSGRKQQIQCRGWPTPGICLKPVPIPHTDGRADGKGEEGSPRVDAVCRRHRVVRRQGCGHDRVPGESWRKALEERGMRVSRPKTQFIDFSFEQNAQGNRTQVQILGEEVERVTHVKYLGTSIEEEGGMETDIAKRVGAGWMNWKKCSGVLCDKNMPVKLKGKVYRTVVIPAMLYGAETWATTKRQASRIEVNEMRMLRWMCGVTRKDKIRNEHIRGTTKVAQSSRKITERRLKWYGHVMRMEEDHLVKRVMTKAIPGKRKRGRPKTRWKDVCKRDMQTVGLREGDEGDRAYWKEMINNHSGDPI